MAQRSGWPLARPPAPPGRRAAPRPAALAGRPAPAGEKLLLCSRIRGRSGPSGTSDGGASARGPRQAGARPAGGTPCAHFPDEAYRGKSLGQVAEEGDGPLGVGGKSLFWTDGQPREGRSLGPPALRAFLEGGSRASPRAEQGCLASKGGFPGPGPAHIYAPHVYTCVRAPAHMRPTWTRVSILLSSFPENGRSLGRQPLLRTSLVPREPPPRPGSSSCRGSGSPWPRETSHPPPRSCWARRPPAPPPTCRRDSPLARPLRAPLSSSSTSGPPEGHQRWWPGRSSPAGAKGSRARGGLEAAGVDTSLGPQVWQENNAGGRPKAGVGLR
ncbi:basic salivary proline-rich protein 1-like [Monodelphis domestica]|uniref:basic salivary proline-rich protein 1-like n=1 Tax=Monodelphis domestica TaxID=13616 RepID=UPI0024E23FC5|nr:basic salivary proline-rich protein 1-like [Monodelphis domestica]